MRSTSIRFIFLISLIILLTIACQTIDSIGERADTVRATAASVATDVQEGRDLVGTVRAITTQVGGSGLIQTAQALATQADESGLLATAQTFATQQGPGLLATAQAFATDQGPGLVQTVLAVATQKGPEVLGTAQAYITQSAQSGAPQDIPIIEGSREMYFTSPELVSYTISVPYAQAVEFYKNQMPLNGWTKVERDWVESEATANLQFEKADRRASVILTTSAGGAKTIVLITIEKK